MEKFKFCVMGAADIANKFCGAVAQMEDAQVAAVASRSMDRAKAFAEKHGIPKAYDSYEEMLIQEKPDAVYIAVVTSAHYELCKLCLKHNVNILCEKTMCTSAAQTKDVFEEAKQRGVFVMEAMWSRFLPTINKVKQWLKEGRIGEVSYASINVGFMAQKDDRNRFWDPALGGGCAFDLTVYCYEIMTYLMEGPILEMQTSSVFHHTGVDASNHILLRYENALASLNGSLVAHLEEKMEICGSKGSIVVPSPHFASKAKLLDPGGNVLETFEDPQTNGFVYETREVIECVRAGKIESETVPHSITIEFSEVSEKLTKQPEA